MDFYVDILPTPSPSVFYSTQASKGNTPNGGNSVFGKTRFVTADFSGLDFAISNQATDEQSPGIVKPIDATALNTQIFNTSTGSKQTDRYVQPKELEIHKIAEDRVKILAMKYAKSELSTETLARLEILNSRLIERSPRVTQEQVNFLESQINSINSVESSRLARAQRLGLKI